ncbi:uncharacterized protein LOC129594705 [Paramacrobiotus metropolitanus]|uniref:uncharacterized protein LOC129594705 n=1 Tax=Paramacrobiotus metropolitanus TaxID=2943436 RepID=UPI002445944F|nr:uncharacterized protein LOC129594705 [Paramacrobiotus metropolitanus]
MARRSCMVAGLSFLLVIVQGDYSQQQSTAKGCGIPIVVNTVPIPDPARLAGTWYKHRHTGAATVNQIFNHVALNRTGLPFTLTSAVGTYIHIEQYNSVSDTQCINRFYIGVCGTNGQCPGKGLSSVDDYVPINNDFNMLYLDIDNFYIVYACGGPNYKTGMCDRPSFHVITRNRPDKLTADQVKAMDDITDAILTPYCFSAADIPQQAHTDSKPYCPFIDFPPCVQRDITGLMNDVRNATSN